MKKATEVQHNIFDYAEDDQAERRVLSHWNLPATKDDILGLLPQLDFLDNSINEKLSDACMDLLQDDRRDQFEREFRTACKISMIVAGDLPPEKRQLRQDYARTIKRLSPLIDKLDKELKRTGSYVRDALEDKIESVVKESPKNFMKRYAHMTDSLMLALESPDTEDYFQKLKGGHVKAANRRAALSAMAESYHRCFDVMPTTSENSAFRSYAGVFYDWLGLHDENGDIKEDTLLSDLKIIIKCYKAKLKG